MPRDPQRLLPHEEEEFYRSWFQKIETLFSALRGRSLLLSPADYHLALDWYRKSIPLSCVLRGIREAFYRRMAEGDLEEEILSLRWCSWAVMKEWKAYKLTAVAEEEEPGHRSAEAPEPGAGESGAVLDSLRWDLRAAIGEARRRDWDELANALEAVAGELERMGTPGDNRSTDQIEETLAILDGRMMAAVEAAFPAAEKAALDKAVGRKLKSLAAGMSADARESSRIAALASRMRLELRLPKLTLYGI